MVIGVVHESNSCGVFKILKYTNSTNVKLQFTSTGFITTKTACNIRAGRVKDPNHPTVCGVGYLGSGNHTITKDKIAYNTWTNMLKRCYSGNYPSYLGCTVIREWYCFQNFANWFYDNYTVGYHLDKDIIGTGKEYSPANCRFVSQGDNTKHAKGTLGRSWVLTHISTGVDIVVTTQTTFAKENDLTQVGINALCTGKLKTSQGYKLKEVINKETQC